MATPTPTTSAPQTFAALRKQQYARLDAENHLYLDYTGAGLPPQTLLTTHFTLLSQTPLGNPHSSNPTSHHSTTLLSETRAKILAFFHAPPHKYTLIFTSNATAAIKLVAEAFPFTPHSTLALLADNHNSVHGIREYARRAHARTVYFPLAPDLRAASDTLPHLARHPPRAPSLFAYPAQSNFSGVKHARHLAHVAHRLGYTVLLDAAAYAPTNRLDIPATRADFVPISFYKMFGFPTGVGALIARNSALRRLRRPWFAGGTVRFASVRGDAHVLEDGPEAYEDGTVNFLGIPAVASGLDFLESVGMENISHHVARLTAQLLKGLLALRHPNCRPVVVVYGPTTMESRGGTVAFNVKDEDGDAVPPLVVEEAASRENISLRTGCFCNPGAAEAAGVIDRKLAAKCLGARRGRKELDTDGFLNCLGDPSFGAVRVSLGLAATSSDVRRFLQFMQQFCAKSVEMQRNVDGMCRCSGG